MFGMFKSSKFDDLEETLEALGEQIIYENRNATFVFDFKKMNAFSIERSYHPTRGYMTIIEYIFNDSVKETRMFCSLEQHEKLVGMYLESKNSATNHIP